MKYAIKDWHKFQHFKDRRPPWIKLYRDILDDREWFTLNAQASKVLVMLWLIASEDNGNLPSIEDLSFRMRMPINELQKHINALSHWLIQDDIAPISGGCRDDAPETETETETETEKKYRTPMNSAALFDRWYAEYPRKQGIGAARKAWAKYSFDAESVDDMIAVLAWQKRVWARSDPKFIPMPSTYLNQERWRDEKGKQLGDTYNSENPDAPMPF